MGTFPGKSSWGNSTFQLEYKNRYQDLLNTALKCENLLAHYDYVVNLFKKEMWFHEDPGSTPKPGRFPTTVGVWDTNCVHLRQAIEGRCNYMQTAFNKPGCFQMYGPYDLTVDVYPAGAGNVRVNSIVPPYYAWSGKYFNTIMGFKAIPTSTNYVFHHWEFKNHTARNNTPLSLDTVSIDFARADEVLAVFTDITNDIDLPTGFSPNGDGNNDEFKPLGSALYTTEYDFRIWNRWGQEVFRSTDPAHGWDGNYEGHQSQTGVYAYVITYKNVFNESKIKKGNVTLVR
jgi:gliding motility-associated-like protein